MESAYWPGNEKERVATELKRHGGMRYMMSGPWIETSCEYYEEIQQLAWLIASREITRGIAAHSIVATAAHARYHQKTMGGAGFSSAGRPTLTATPHSYFSWGSLIHYPTSRPGSHTECFLVLSLSDNNATRDEIVVNIPLT